MITIHNKFKLGDFAYLKTDVDQFERMVTGVKICLTNEILYELSCGVSVTWHYEYEISSEKRIL